MLTVYILQLIILKRTKIKTNVSPFLKIKIGKNEMLFLPETHSTTSDDKKWKDEFSEPAFY